MPKDMNGYPQKNSEFFVFDGADAYIGNSSKCKECKETICHRNSEDTECCCKDALKKSINLLLNPCLKNLINLSTFTLIGQNFATTEGATTIKSIINCTDGIINFTDETGVLSFTTFCDLIAISFNLADVPIAGADTEEELRALFSIVVQKLLPKFNPDKYCCIPDEECCCNLSKAKFLANSISPVNIQLNTSALEVNPIINLTVITVTENIAWFINDDNTVVIACLDNIVALG